ncbi:MAG: hypothetical protein AAGI71_16130 [Bacteroidota bacterium]
MRLTYIGPGSAAKICAVLYAALGLVFALIYMPFLVILSSVGAEYGGGMTVGIGMAIGLVIFVPIVYGVLGLIIGALSAWLFNVVAGWVGGLEIDIMTDA